MLERLFSKFSSNLDFLQPFEERANIAVALSGGVDSMVLLTLTDRWVRQIGGNLTAITIDHKLRESSEAEAMQVKAICEKLGIKHIILKWNHGSITSNIQAKARSARYDLLTSYCHQNDILHLFTGHHLEDRVENFFIKLSRASGILGLIEGSQNFVNNVRICKPILNFTKNECRSILEEKLIPHVEDPSNAKQDYFRNELRFKLQGFFDLKSIDSKLFQTRIANSQNNLAFSARLTQKEAILALCNCVTIYNAGFAIVKHKEFFEYEQDIKGYLLSYLLRIISGDDSDIRAEKITALIKSISSFKPSTLNKCIIDFTGKDIIIYKEKRYIEDREINLTNGLIWDKRFCIQNACQNLTITTLGLQGYNLIKDKVDLELINDANKHARKILFTLPTIKRLEKIVSIPNIDYCDELTGENISSNFAPWYKSKIFHLNIKNNYSYE
jgi:tRNA(Ile)-lysidine synthase